MSHSLQRRREHRGNAEYREDYYRRRGEEKEMRRRRCGEHYLFFSSLLFSFLCVVAVFSAPLR